MKEFILILFALVLTFSVFAQDTIQKRNGEIIIGNVKEINERDVVYTLHGQNDGPIRKISLVNVAQITYEDGLKERFTTVESPRYPRNSPQDIGEPGTINNTDRTVVVPRRGPDLRIRPGQRFPTEEDLQKNIIYFEALLGVMQSSTEHRYSSANYPYRTEVNPAIGARFGSKHYIGSNAKRKMGFNVSYAHVMITTFDAEIHLGLAPLNVGLTSYFRTNENTVIELNATTGGALFLGYSRWQGLKYGIDFKIRHKHLIVGVDLARIDSYSDFKPPYANMMSFSCGIAFY